jgi:hypothetical protein
MAGATRFRRKLDQRERQDQLAVRYEPGQHLGDLLKLAREADSDAELDVATFFTGKVLVVRWERVSDAGNTIEYLVVESGHWLAFDPGEGFLYESTDGNWSQWYEQVSQ